MSATEFFKCGAERRQDSLTRLSATNYLLIFGYGEEDGQGYNWRKYYDHKPTSAELKEDIVKLIDSATDKTILTGFKWQGNNVYLSTENQMNFKAAYDLAVQTGGQTLPIKFKLGEDAEGSAVYHVFSELEEFADFYTKAVAFVVSCLNEGWEEKDGIDYEKLIADE